MIAMEETEKGGIIYVTVGVPFSSIPIMSKVVLFVNYAKETHVQVAKKLRKQVAENIENHGWVRGTEFNPSELYYEIYANVDNEFPYFCSSNSPKASIVKEIESNGTIVASPA